MADLSKISHFDFFSLVIDSIRSGRERERESYKEKEFSCHSSHIDLIESHVLQFSAEKIYL